MANDTPASGTFAYIIEDLKAAVGETRLAEAAVQRAKSVLERRVTHANEVEYDRAMLAFNDARRSESAAWKIAERFAAKKDAMARPNGHPGLRPTPRRR